MGIRCYCPNGHRLNIKAFLAGRVGVCPQCQAKFRIPTESEPLRQTTDGPPSNQAAGGNPGGQTSAQTAPQPSPTNSTPASEVAPAAVPQHPAAQPAAQQPQQPVAQQSQQPVAQQPASQQPQQSVAQQPAPQQPFSQQPVSQQPVSQQPVSQQPQHASPQAAVQQPAAAQPQPQQPPPPAQPVAPAALPDPISEAPHAVWYVRPPSGGEFGPAKGDIMRKWVTEGRVTPDSLVWREGWPDWRLADGLFPNL